MNLKRSLGDKRRNLMALTTTFGEYVSKDGPSKENYGNSLPDLNQDRPMMMEERNGIPEISALTWKSLYPSRINSWITLCHSKLVVKEVRPA